MSIDLAPVAVPVFVAVRAVSVPVGVLARFNAAFSADNDATAAAELLPLRLATVSAPVLAVAGAGIRAVQ